jgi:hypothetical protein
MRKFVIQVHEKPVIAAQECRHPSARNLVIAAHEMSSSRRMKPRRPGA